MVIQYCSLIVIGFRPAQSRSNILRVTVLAGSDIYAYHKVYTAWYVLVRAQRVVTFRKKLGLLQVQLADRLGVKQASVSRWESGSREPSVENYIRMGNLADEGDCLWFWEQGGVDVKRIDRWISARRTPSKKSHKT